MRRSAVCWLCVLVLLALAVLIYGRSVTFGYVWDDSILFLDRTALLNEPLSWALLSEPVLAGTSYLRPLMFLTLYIEFNFLGQQPAISHAVNVGLLCLNTLLVFTIGCRLASVIQRQRVYISGLLAAVLYLTHPALVESTAWVSGRFDQLVTTFVLFSVLVYLAHLRPLIKVLLLALLMMGALLSKELGVVLPVVLLCIWMALYYRQDEGVVQALWRGLRTNAAMLAVLLAIFAYYLWLRAISAGGIYHYSLSWAYVQDAWWGQLLPLEALKFYIQQTLLPFSTIHLLHPVSELTPWQFTSLLASIGALGFILLLLIACWRRSLAGWLALAGLVCLAPVMHFLPLSILENVGHERFMTTALAFFSLAVVFLPWQRLSIVLRVPPLAALRITGLLLVGWLTFSLWTVHSILPFWASDLQLWNWAYKSYPQMGVARYNYLYGALQEGRGDLIADEVKYLQEKNGGLEVGEQVLYANLLMRRADPESMRYLEGVMYALPKFHETEDGKLYINNYYLTATQMGGIYADYAMGQLIFEGDRQKAAAYNNIGQWYMRESEKIPLRYQLVAIEYALGNFEEAEALWVAQRGRYYHRSDAMEEMVRQLLERYCGHEKAEVAVCIKLQGLGLIEQ